jgi:hydroxymethylpyrimidine pyrophosphatase-like HAD family hydrolase
VAAIQGAGVRHGAPPILFAMHEGRDRLAWLQPLTTVYVEAFLSRRRGDPRLLPLQTWEAIDTDSVFYVSLIADEQTLRQVRDEVTDELEGCHVVLSEDNYTQGQFWLELSSSAATKACAIGALRRELGADRLVCFGDNLNDLPMFAAADHAVAVSNAVPEVRRAADEIIGSNDDDAVADWLSFHA